MGSMRNLSKVPFQLDELLPEQLDSFLESGRFPLTEETTCGYWIFRGKCLQRLTLCYASKITDIKKKLI